MCTYGSRSTTQVLSGVLPGVYDAALNSLSSAVSRSKPDLEELLKVRLNPVRSDEDGNKMCLVDDHASRTEDNDGASACL